jgi:hypothetical protein
MPEGANLRLPRRINNQRAKLADNGFKGQHALFICAFHDRSGGCFVGHPGQNLGHKFSLYLVRHAGHSRGQANRHLALFGGLPKLGLTILAHDAGAPYAAVADVC